MTEEQPKKPQMAMARLIRPAVEEMLGQIDRRIDRRTEAALRPLIARIEDLERQLAELRGAPSSGPTSESSADDPAIQTLKGYGAPA